MEFAGNTIFYQCETNFIFFRVNKNLGSHQEYYVTSKELLTMFLHLLRRKRKVAYFISVYLTNTDVFGMDFTKNMKNVLYLSRFNANRMM